jgi:DNA polymerase-4
MSLPRVVLHLDMDAFYAAVEVREDPALAGRPLIIGHRGKRGVVSTCSYEARAFGVRSAMPSVIAERLCPGGVWLPGRMSVYVEVSRRIRTILEDEIPVVEPLSIDEAFLDLTGTEALHGAAPAQLLAALALRVENSLGITVSIGLSYNKFLAKLASDLDKPRGFAVIGRADAATFLADKPVGLLWGVGAAMQRRFAADGIALIGQLRALDDRELARRYGKMGARLARLARGDDFRHVEPVSQTKSISAETTFARDEADCEALARTLWPLCEKVAQRLKQSALAAGTVTLKLKTSDFRLRTRSRRLADPTQLADTIYRTARHLLATEADGATRFRLIGVGADGLVEGGRADLPTLFDREDSRPRHLEEAIDAVRDRHGADAVQFGRALRRDKAPS